jgi:hypothetical protein
VLVGNIANQVRVVSNTLSHQITWSFESQIGNTKNIITLKLLVAHLDEEIASEDANLTDMIAIISKYLFILNMVTNMAYLEPSFKQRVSYRYPHGMFATSIEL